MASHEPSRDKGMSAGIEFLTFQHSRTNQGGSSSTRTSIVHGSAEQMVVARSASTGGMMMPVQQLLSPNEKVMDTLSGLSIEQLSSMEETLRRAKMSRRQQLSGSIETKAPSAPTTTRPPTKSTQASNMKQFMSVMNTTPKNPLPPDQPSIKTVDGVPWLTFNYATRSSVSTPCTVRVDIDQIALDDILTEFQEANCLYPSANGAEEEYKGSRRDYERECNEQGWKLAHLNPTILSERKGILQRAVISLRNVSIEQKSRRVKRQEKRIQCKAVKKDARGPVLPIPRLTGPSVSRVLLSGPLQPGSPLPLTWQPAMVSSLHDGTQRPVPSDVTPQQQEPQQQISSTPLPSPRLPSLGSFASSLGAISSLEFDGYIHGQFKRLRLQVNIGDISVNDLPLDFKKNNCVYPRSFQTQDDTSEHWNTYGIRQAEESFLNEIGWKLCSINSGLLNGKRLLLQQALDAYRRRFLPSTGQPRARVGPSLLTRRNSSSNPVYSLFNGSDPPSRSIRHRNQQARVRFDTREPITRKAHVDVAGEPYRGDQDGLDKGSTEEVTGEEDGNEDDEDDYDDDDDDEGEGFEEDDEDDDDEEPSEGDSFEGDSFEDESGDGSSSEDVFHSQMSLLSFTGSIRTYSLGTGSGSARSRPRIQPTSTSAASSGNVSSPLSRPETLPTRKRSWTEFTLQTHLNNSNGNRVRFEKRIRHDDIEGQGQGSKQQEVVPSGVQDVLGNEQQGHEDIREPESGARAGVAVENGGGSDGEGESESEQEEGEEEEDEDDVDWWKSRLNNSEYAEDHQMVSMTTEELIGALTNCYNSDVEDYYDEED